MAGEVKLVFQPVEQVSNQLNESAGAMQHNFSSKIEGKSELDFVTKINDLNTAYSALMGAYQEMLLEHIETTKQTTKAFKNTDEKLASSISFGLHK